MVVRLIQNNLLANPTKDVNSDCRGLITDGDGDHADGHVLDTAHCVCYTLASALSSTTENSLEELGQQCMSTTV